MKSKIVKQIQVISGALALTLFLASINENNMNLILEAL